MILGLNLKQKLISIIITAIIAIPMISLGGYLGLHQNSAIINKPVAMAERVFSKNPNADESVVNSNKSSLQSNIKAIRTQFNHHHGIKNIKYSEDSNTLNFYFSNKPTDKQAQYATKLGQNIKADNHDDGLVIQLKLLN